MMEITTDILRMQIELMSGIPYEMTAEMHGVTAEDVRRLTRQMRDCFAENCTLVLGRYKNTVRVQPQFLRRVHKALLAVKRSDALYCREFFLCPAQCVFWRFLFQLHFYYGDSVFRCPDGYPEDSGHPHLLSCPIFANNPPYPLDKNRGLSYNYTVSEWHPDAILFYLKELLYEHCYRDFCQSCI